MRTHEDLHDLPELPDVLARRAEDVRPDPRIPEGVLRRARRRRGLTAGLSVAAAVLVSAGAWTGVRAALEGGGTTPLHPTPSPSVTTDPPVTGEWRGLWPHATRQEAEDAQACADQGDPACTWQVEIEAFLERYGSEELGWDAVYFDEALDVGEPNAYTTLDLTIYSCEVLKDPCPSYDFAEVRSERLVRQDPTGIWSVTSISTGSAHGDPPEAFGPTQHEVEELVDSFMAARREGSGAEGHLATEALDAYADNRDGLHLYGEPAADSDGRIIAGWTIDHLSLDDDSTWSIEITIELHWLGDSPPSTTRELLIVGGGRNAAGDSLVAVVLMVQSIG